MHVMGFKSISNVLQRDHNETERNKRILKLCLQCFLMQFKKKIPLKKATLNGS